MGVGGNPRIAAKPPALWSLRSTISPLHPLRQAGDLSQAASGARFRRRRGARALSAIRGTALHEDATGSSTPDSGPENPARGSQANPATQKSGGATHRAPPTTATDCQRRSPARRACRAGPTPPCGVFDPEPGPPRPLPPYRGFPRHAIRSRTLGLTEWGNDTLHGPCTAPIGRTRTDERHKLIGGTDQLD